jgi:hypothetical protein
MVLFANVLENYVVHMVLNDFFVMVNIQISNRKNKDFMKKQKSKFEETNDSFEINEHLSLSKKFDKNECQWPMFYQW